MVDCDQGHYVADAHYFFYVLGLIIRKLQTN
jgi:hypothetical protein